MTGWNNIPNPENQMAATKTIELLDQLESLVLKPEPTNPALADIYSTLTKHRFALERIMRGVVR